MKLSVSCEGEPKEIITLRDNADNKNKVMEITKIQYEKIAKYLPKGQRKNQQSSTDKCNIVCRGKRLQMEGFTERIW